MTYKDYCGMCDGLIKTGYHIVNSTNEDTEWKLRMTEKQRFILLRMAKRLVEAFENEVDIIPEKPPQKVRVSIKKR